MSGDFVTFPIEGDEMVCSRCGARFPHTFEGLMTGARPHAQEGCEATS